MKKCVGWHVGVVGAVAATLSPALVLASPPAADAAPRVSALDWLLSRTTPTTPHTEQSRLWLSDDGLFELHLHEGGSLRLRPSALPRPGATGVYTAPDRHTLMLRLPMASPLSVGVGAGFAQTTTPCPATAGALCLGPPMAPLNTQQLGRIGVGLAGEVWQIDLSYARIRLSNDALLSALSDTPWWSLGERLGPDSINVYELHGEELGLSGRFDMPGVDSVVLGLSLGQWRPVSGPWVNDLQQQESATLSFGLSRGALHGEISSRFVHSEPLGQSPYYWSGLDLGVSWRMPWHGEFQFGARNLVTRTQPSSAPPTSPATDEARARTPYVRYHQHF